MAASTVTARLRAAGILDPGTTVAEAQRAGLPLKLACAMLEKESAGGHNVFGHDRGTIFAGAGAVTEAKYREYKRKRIASGNKHMQGVGPCQLTWWSIQDAADEAGGCWRPEINMRLGFGHLAGLVKQHGEADGARRYNGSGDAAIAYSKDLMAKARKWETILAGAKVAGVATSRVVRRGDTGPLAEKVTRRLSYVRSRTTRAPYLDGARARFGPKAEAALKAFQAEHGLTADGVFGPATARKLNRAVRVEKLRRQQGGSVPAPAPGPDPAPARAVPKVARVKLPALVAQVRHLDDETDEAWKTLVAYADRRRRLLERLRGRKTGGAEVDAATAQALADMAKILLRIEDKLGTLVEVEQREAAVPTPSPAAGAAIASESARPEPGSTTVAEATVVQAAEGAPAVGGNGGGGLPTTPVPPGAQAVGPVRGRPRPAGRAPRPRARSLAGRARPALCRDRGGAGEAAAGAPPERQDRRRPRQGPEEAHLQARPPGWEGRHDQARRPGPARAPLETRPGSLPRREGQPGAREAAPRAAARGAHAQARGPGHAAVAAGGASGPASDRPAGDGRAGRRPDAPAGAVLAA